MQGGAAISRGECLGEKFLWPSLSLRPSCLSSNYICLDLKLTNRSMIFWSVHDQSRDQCMINYLNSAWSITWPVHGNYVIIAWSATWSVHDSHVISAWWPRDQCMISHMIRVWSATWSVHDIHVISAGYPRDHFMIIHVICTWSVTWYVCKRLKSENGEKSHSNLGAWASTSQHPSVGLRGPCTIAQHSLALELRPEIDL